MCELIRRLIHLLGYRSSQLLYLFHTIIYLGFVVTIRGIILTTYLNRVVQSLFFPCLFRLTCFYEFFVVKCPRCKLFLLLLEINRLVKTIRVLVILLLTFFFHFYRDVSSFVCASTCILIYFSKVFADVHYIFLFLVFTFQIYISIFLEFFLFNQIF